MANIINQWIAERLGIIIKKFPEEFANMTKDGYLLCQLLKGYGIITHNDLELIKNPENLEKCLSNFKLIAHWLQQIGVSFNDDEISEIVNANGVTSMNLFYKVYLALYDKMVTDFAGKQIFTENFTRDSFSKFIVKKPVEESRFLTNKRNAMLEDNFDIIHWHRDRLEMMINKCKLAREEYIHVVKNRERRKSSFSLLLDSPDTKELKKYDSSCSVESLNLPYVKLIAEQKKAQHLKQFSPNPNECKKVMKNIKNKHKSQETAAILKRELHKKILWMLWQQIKDEEKGDFDNSIIEKLLKHSFYEKQMLRKLEEAKFHRETLMESKRIVADKINKEKEKEFIDKLAEVDNESKIVDIQYYLEKERSLHLHKKLYETKMKLHTERCYKMCNEVLQQLCNYALNMSEYVSYYGEQPKQSIIDSWKQMFICGLPLEDNSSIPAAIVQPSDNDEIESIMHLELEKQDKIDKQDFNSYIKFERPWELENIDIVDNALYEMQCGQNVLGYIVYHLLETKNPVSSTPQAPNLPKMEIAVCINDLYEFSCIPVLKKLLKHKNYEIFEMQDVINFCINAYKEEVTLDEVENYEIIEIKVPEVNKLKKGMKTKQKISSEPRTQGNESNNNKVVNDKMEKKIQTPRYFPCEEVVLSAEAELGKIADEELTRGQPLTDFLLVAMLIEYLKSKTNMKGYYYPYNNSLSCYRHIIFTIFYFRVGFD